MRICLINGQLGHAFETLGHEVLTISAQSGVSDVRALLAPTGFKPELILQTEVLGPRVILAGLHALDCRKVFWSVDTHLNAFWHAHYGLLFDAVATTQPSWVARLRALGLPQVFSLPWFGVRSSWRPFAERHNPVAFCGRMSPNRPLRQRFAYFLQTRFKARIEQNLSVKDMLSLFSQTLILPNEAIAREINFRLFEAASQGCVVLTPQTPGLENLFNVGHEIETYSNVVELANTLSRLLADPVRMERMGRAAYGRTMAEHMPEHRAMALLETLPTLAPAAVTGRGAALSFHLTLLGLLESDRMEISPSFVAQGLLLLQDIPEAVSGLIRLYAYTGLEQELRTLLEGVLVGERFAGEFSVNAVGSLAALSMDCWDMAKVFWYRHSKATGLPAVKPETPMELERIWGTLFARQGSVVRMGFVFDAARHVPQSAFEALTLASRHAPENLGLKRTLEALLSGYHGTEEMRLGLLSEISLHDREDWRVGLRLGMVNLQAFRLQEGIEELQVAYASAQAQGASSRFHKAIASLDPTGTVRAAFLG